MSFSRLIFIILLTQTSHINAQKNKKEVPIKSIDSLTFKMSKQEGLITTYQKESKVFFEISKELLDEDLLMVTRFVSLPANYQAYLNAGSKTSQQLVHFKKKGPQLLPT